jgi:hypothetical protein
MCRWILTALRWTVVLARSRSARTGATSLLNAQSPALMDLTLKALLGRVSLLSGNHLNETKAARVLCVRVAHDVALLDLAILLEETGDLFLGERGVDARHEQVGARVATTRLVIFLVARSWGWAAVLN